MYLNRCWHISNSAFCCFFFNDTATTEIYTLSLHDALPISRRWPPRAASTPGSPACRRQPDRSGSRGRDRKSTRLNSSHANISYAVFCLKKNNDGPGAAAHVEEQQGPQLE